MVILRDKLNGTKYEIILDLVTSRDKLKELNTRLSGHGYFKRPPKETKYEFISTWLLQETN